MFLRIFNYGKLEAPRLYLNDDNRLLLKVQIIDTFTLYEIVLVMTNMTSSQVYKERNGMT